MPQITNGSIPHGIVPEWTVSASLVDWRSGSKHTLRFNYESEYQASAAYQRLTALLRENGAASNFQEMTDEWGCTATFNCAHLQLVAREPTAHVERMRIAAARELDSSQPGLNVPMERQMDLSKLRPGDVVTVRAEVDCTDHAHEILLDVAGVPVYVPPSDIISIEPRPISVGDRVRVREGYRVGRSGNVVAVCRDEAWVDFGDECATYPLDNLTPADGEPT